ncbi:MAG: hypothetical protein ACTSYB_19275 [Candidatus Helarchaeota archaeon]
MRILKLWIFSLNGQQLFFKEYENFQDNILSNMLNTGVIHSFINFFNTYLVKKYCDLILFDDILFTFDYMHEASLPFITLVITKIDKRIELDVQIKVLKKVAQRISQEFHDCYDEIMIEMKNNLNYFQKFEKKCDNLLQSYTKTLDKVEIGGL